MESLSSVEIGQVYCPKCRHPLPGGPAPATEALNLCEKCRCRLRIWSYPGAGGALSILRTGEMAVPGEAICFFHAEKKAERTCDRCGRFICLLCDMPLGKSHLCPTCLGSGVENEKVPELVQSRFIWSGLSLSLGILPLLLFFVFLPFLVLTGPAAIFCGFWGWRKPGSLVHGRRRWSAVLGIVGGVLQLAILGAFAFGLWFTANRHV